jgi:HK97 family phage major capsid protein
MQEQLDRVETILNRPGALGGSDKAKEEEPRWRGVRSRACASRPPDRDPADMDLVRKHMNTLVKGNDAGAGYLLAPPDMQRDILKNVIEMTPMRSICSVKTIGSPELQAAQAHRHATATRVGETGTRSNTGDPAYGMLEILAPELFARFEVSQQMLEDSDYDLLAELRMESAEQFSYKEGYESINGTGAGTNQCEGILVNADIGEVVSGSASAITADGMIDLYHAVKTAYTRNGMFGLNRASLKAVRKLKDTTNQYLWIPGIANASPNTILGRRTSRCRTCRTRRQRLPGAVRRLPPRLRAGRPHRHQLPGGLHHRRRQRHRGVPRAQAHGRRRAAGRGHQEAEVLDLIAES